MDKNCKNCKYDYQSYHCLDCSDYHGKFEDLEMSIEKVDELHRGEYLNAKISFKFRDVLLDDDLIEELGELIACTWNADDIYKTGENAIYLIIDHDWWDDSYDAEQKESVEKEMFEDAETLFARQIKRLM